MQIATNKQKDDMGDDLYKNVVHYIIYYANNKYNMGATQLNKILWFSDCFYYLKYGKTITGTTYQKQNYGPVPKKISSIINILIENQIIKQDNKKIIDFSRHEFISIKDPTENTDSEILTILQDNISYVCDYTAEEISNKTHEKPTWRLTKNYETIPFCAVIADNNGEITDEDIQWAKERVENAFR